MLGKSVRLRIGVGLEMRSESNFVAFLKTQGYSERAIEEICKWYVSSTTKSVAGNVPVELKN